MTPAIDEARQRLAVARRTIEREVERTVTSGCCDFATLRALLKASHDAAEDFKNAIASADL